MDVKTNTVLSLHKQDVRFGHLSIYKLKFYSTTE